MEVQEVGLDMHPFGEWWYSRIYLEQPLPYVLSTYKALIEGSKMQGSKPSICYYPDLYPVPSQQTCSNKPYVWSLDPSCGCVSWGPNFLSLANKQNCIVLLYVVMDKAAVCLLLSYSWHQSSVPYHDDVA